MDLLIKFADKQPKDGALVWVLNGRTKRAVLRRFRGGMSYAFWEPGRDCRPTDLWCRPEPPKPPGHANLKPKS